MTNQEKNIRLAELLGYEVQVDFSTGSEHYTMENENGLFPLTSWVENWSELMPLVVEHKISIQTRVDMNSWFASKELSLTDTSYDAHTSCNMNPRTALVDCLISVLEAKLTTTEQG